VVNQSSKVHALRSAFAKVPALYIADGHHRSASASRVAAKRTGQGAHSFFLSVTFPDNQMKILDYNRVVFDLNGQTEEQVLERVREKFDVSPCAEAKPNEARTFTMMLGESWYRLRAKAGTFPADDPVDGLDVSILQDNLLAPILGIGDPRTDNRIGFVGGIRGTGELARRCGVDAAIAFALYPTSMKELMAIADVGQIMPPKSTWFEPKLRSGLFVRSIKSE
jgi:uncharacterized protein (DUF1015 family)